MLVEVPISSIVTERSDFTIATKCAGIPPGDVWFLKHAVELAMEAGGSENLETFYEHVHAVSASWSPRSKREYFSTIVDIARGVREGRSFPPLIGTRLASKVELHDGHHRVCALDALGQKSVSIELSELVDPLKTAGPADLAGLRELYRKVESVTCLPPGMTYNPFPGVEKSIRGNSRLPMVYEAIISSTGNTLVDLGCNDGYFGTSLYARWFQVTMVEKQRELFEVAQRRAQLVKGSIPIKVSNGDVIKFVNSCSEGSYDVVLLLDVLQHVLREQGSDCGIWFFAQAMHLAADRMIFSTEWNEASSFGFTRRKFVELASSNGMRIEYLGRDRDPSPYGRELFALHRR